MKKAILSISFALLLCTGNAILAQTDENPIFATSGPNILDKGGMLLHNELSFEYLDINVVETKESIFSLGSSFRLGIGHNTELNLKLAAGYLQSVNVSDVKMQSEMLVPSLGVKVGLFEGRGVLPQMSFSTDVAIPLALYFGEQSNADFMRPQPTIGLEFRNRIGRRFAIDYSLGYNWHSYGYVEWNDGLRYSLAFNALITERLALGIAWGKGNFRAINDGGTSISNSTITYLTNKVNATLLYQATPNLQLSMRGNMQLGSSFDNWSDYSTTAELTAGFSWKF